MAGQGGAGDGRAQCVEPRALAELDAGRVSSRAREQVARWLDRRRGVGSERRGPLQQPLDRHARVGRLRDEGGIGAVLEQPSHEVGEQVAMRADRCVGAAGVTALGLDEAVVERVAHPVQALELVALRADAGGDRGHRRGVVGGELRIEPRPQRQQPRGGGLVGEVGHRLRGEDGVARKPPLLGALDLGVPVGALDEAHHQPPVVALGERRDMVDHGEAPLLVGLDRQAEAVPAGERGVGQHRLDHVERKLEAVGLLGVDGEVEVEALRRPRQLEDHRDQLGHHPRALRRLVARVQRRELDRDAGSVGQGGVAGGAADRLDRLGVAPAVGLGVGRGAGAFAEHVEGIAVEPAGRARGALEGGLDRLAEHEMVAHQPHRLPRRRAHGGLAEAPGGGGQDAVGRVAGARRSAPRARVPRPTR